MLRINSRQIKQLERDLKNTARRAFPFATKHTVNASAFAARDESKTLIRENMILKNAWTARTVQVNQTRTLNVRRQMATVGSTEQYMERQEFGGTVVKKGKRGIPLATSYAAGQGMNRRPRTKLPKRAHLFDQIRLHRNRRTRGSRRLSNMTAIREAQAKKKFVYLKLQKSEGIFKIIGSRKKPIPRMVYDLSHDSLQTPRNPWLAPSVARAGRKIPEIYMAALKFQLDRQRLLK